MGKCMKKKLAILLLTCCTLQVVTKFKRKRKSLWTRKWLLRRNSGRGVLHMLSEELRLEDSLSYRNYLRMNEDCFMKIVNRIRGTIEKKDTNMRESISPEMRVAVTLRYLATGVTLRDLSYGTRIAHNTLSNIIKEVLHAICQHFSNEYLKVPNKREWKKIEEVFSQRWNFPHCVGAIDGKHINFRPLRADGAFYRNYKGSDSIVLLALVGSTYQFLAVDIGINGRISDGGVFSRSPLGQAILQHKFEFPLPEPLPNREKIMPYVIVADDAFPLKNNIMKPFRFRGLTPEKKIFNYRLSRARRIVENAFGILSNRFQIFLKTMNVSVEKVELISRACIILHNFLCCENPTYIDDLGASEQCSMEHIQRTFEGNRTPDEAQMIRNEFMEYFNTTGSVSWQQKILEM